MNDRTTSQHALRRESSTTRDAPVVLKFGGSTVGSPERLARVLGVVESTATQPRVVVVSALADTTDRLIAACDRAVMGDMRGAEVIVAGLRTLHVEVLAGALGIAEAEAMAVVDPIFARFVEADDAAGRAREPALPAAGEAAASAPQVGLRRVLRGIAALGEVSVRSRDLVLAHGELLSSALVAAALCRRDQQAVAVDARAWVVTDERHGEARVDWPATQARIDALAEAWAATITVHTGFIAAAPSGVTTTLGRNGSDYTAALLAKGLRAAAMTIFTDVPGVMTADPSIVPEAYPVEHLSYGETLELATLGFRMLHPRTMVPLIESGVPLWIRDVADLAVQGTRIDAEGATDPERPTCVASLEGMALVELEGTHRSEGLSIGARALRALASAGVDYFAETQAPFGNGVAVIVEGPDAARAREAFADEFARDIDRGAVAAPSVRPGVGVLTLVAETMGRTPNVAGRFYGALGSAGINVLASTQGASQRAISCVVAGDELSLAVRTVHTAFNLARERVDLLVLGKGVVGRELLAQILAERRKLRERHDLEVRVVGVVDSRGAAFEPEGLDLARWHEIVASAPSLEETGGVAGLLDRMRGSSVPVLVDVTAESGMESTYELAWRMGVHVVAANKKPLALPIARYRGLLAEAQRHHRAYRYETTVGASLPVIETLKNLVRTGDDVRLVEGSFSGTLGYLANEIMAGAALSAAVRKARDLGYTEPHPRDDLSGLDVARKAIILARELGLEVDLEDVEIEPFVPASILAEDDLEQFFTALAAHDRAQEAALASLRSEGRALRYLARIDPRGGDGGRASIRVAPVGVPASHPAMRLRGSEAFVAFTTERYADYPLIVQGAGAGGAVTAAGVLADVLALSQTLRGR
jgi:aspartokinase/homoserine dehydrogenase 1